MNDVKSILKDLRKSRNLTQFQLSQALNIGQATIAGYENGSREPHINSLIAYANFFECTIDYLVGREDDLGNVVVQTNGPPPLTDTQKDLLAAFNRLPPGLQVRAIAYVQGLDDAINGPARKYSPGK